MKRLYFLKLHNMYVVIDSTKDLIILAPDKNRTNTFFEKRDIVEFAYKKIKKQIGDDAPLMFMVEETTTNTRQVTDADK